MSIINVFSWIWRSKTDPKLNAKYYGSFNSIRSVVVGRGVVPLRHLRHVPPQYCDCG